MKYDPRLLERYAVQALDMTEPLPPGDPLSVEDIGNSLGLDGVQSKQLAIDMQDERWATLSFATNPARLRLTLAGKKAIAEFRLPGWRRWLNANPGVLAGVVAGATSLAFNAAAEVFKWWLRSQSGTP